MPATQRNHTLTPWWGKGPPPFPYEPRVADDPMRAWLKKRKLWQVLIVLAGLGVGGLVAGALPPHLSRFWHDFLIAAGTAFLIAAILGATVDYWLKKELVADVFPSLFGFTLREELKAELRWVYGQELLVENPTLTLTLTPTEDADLLTLRIQSIVDVRNITSARFRWRPGPLVAVDEWFHVGRESRVLLLRCTQRGKTREDARPLHDVWLRGLRLPELTLDPDESVKVAYEAEETRHVSDAWFLNVIRPTTHPRVSVNRPEWIDYRVMFGSREQGSLQPITPNTWELPGTLLPGQVIQIRWWPKVTESNGNGQDGTVAGEAAGERREDG